MPTRSIDLTTETTVTARIEYYDNADGIEVVRIRWPDWDELSETERDGLTELIEEALSDESDATRLEQWRSSFQYKMGARS